jgi:very-short-patch-repair endonuclease
MSGARAAERRRRQVEAARDLRQRMTPAEELLWTRLRGGQLSGLTFRRQHPVGPFVLDFCCATCRLVVELDGSVHDEQQDQDEERTKLLAMRGYTVIRFRNEDVLSDLEAVLDRIISEARQLESTRLA